MKEAESGRGRGRGRGRGKKAKEQDQTAEEDKKQKKDEKENQKKKSPFLLTNLVRTGNQMGGAGTWTLLEKALVKIVNQRLELCPVSQRPSDDRLRWNQDLLKLLGKVPPDFDILDFDSNPEQRPTKMSASLESAIEFLRSWVVWARARPAVFFWH